MTVGEYNGGYLIGSYLEWVYSKEPYHDVREGKRVTLSVLLVDA